MHHPWHVRGWCKSVANQWQRAVQSHNSKEMEKKANSNRERKIVLVMLSSSFGQANGLISGLCYPPSGLRSHPASTTTSKTVRQKSVHVYVWPKRASTVKVCTYGQSVHVRPKCARTAKACAYGQSVHVRPKRARTAKACTYDQSVHIRPKRARTTKECTDQSVHIWRKRAARVLVRRERVV
jgi:hypothetical protein